MIHILFGSQTGNAQNLAQVIHDSLSDHAWECMVSDMADVDPEEIFRMQKVLVVTSTYGDGEAPDNA